MKKLFALLLVSSLAANAWLLTRASSSPSAPRSAPAVRSERPAAPVETKLLTALDTADLAVLRDQLRASGADESSIRGVIEGALRGRYRAQVAAWRIEQLRSSWWRGGRGSAGGGAAPSQRKMVNEPLRELLGSDPLEMADQEIRYDFLSPEKRRMLALIDLDYADLQARVPLARSNAALKADLDQEQLLNTERRKDVLATLTAEERAEYDLRFSLDAVLNGRRLAGIGISEQEFRAISPVIAKLREQTQTAAFPNDPQAPERIELEQRAVDQVVTAIGYDRALDYLWGSDSGPYASTSRVLREANLPAANASRLLQLAADTGVAATAIHYDATLAPEQKRDALLALQQHVRPQLDALVPPDVQPKLEKGAIGWFGMLAEGRYEQRPPTLFGSGYRVPAERSVSAAPVGPRPVVPQPRRQGN